MSLLREVYGRLVDVAPSMTSFEGCEGLFTHLKDKEAIMEKFSTRHFWGVQQSLGAKELDGAFWLPALGHPTDGFTQVKSDIGPLLILTESI